MVHHYIMRTIKWCTIKCHWCTSILRVGRGSWSDRDLAPLGPREPEHGRGDVQERAERVDAAPGGDAWQARYAWNARPEGSKSQKVSQVSY